MSIYCDRCGHVVTGRGSLASLAMELHIIVRHVGRDRA